MREGTSRWLKRVAVGLAVFIPASLAFLVLSVEVTSQPSFCGSCHFMLPYYQSWKTSTHKNVACVECHIPPGITSEVRKKYEALAMVARYFTGTYSTNPWAEVDDKSCLRSGCHTKRVLLGKEVYQGILFDHQPHLTELRRGKHLRCTSCHSQIVQGSHITVTPTTCFLCHFKDAPLNQGTARCTLCHQVPQKMITTAGLSFDHGDVKRFDMDCTQCHQGVVKGNGEVPRERCFTCHNDEKRLKMYAKTEFLHQKHVTDHKIECLNCHIEIVHKIPKREEVLATGCESCHSAAAGHSAVRDLYRGIGGKGVQPRPAAMYLAGVRCEACHISQEGDTKHASSVSCMSCHGPKSLIVYQAWREGLTQRVAGIKEELQKVRHRVEEKGDGTDHAELQDAQQNLDLLERGHAIHNPPYAADLLLRSHRDLSATLVALGEPALTSLPWLQAPYEAECLKCHLGIEYQKRPIFGREFPHAKHVVSARLRCTVCHETMDHHGGIKLASADACDSCHTRIASPMSGLAAEDCLKCHTADLGKVSDKVNFPHQKHIAAGLDCAMCHDGVDTKPHLEFARSGKAVPKFAHEFCATCHGTDVPDADGVPPEGADCAKCHVEF